MHLNSSATGSNQIGHNYNDFFLTSKEYQNLHQPFSDTTVTLFSQPKFYDHAS